MTSSSSSSAWGSSSPVPNSSSKAPSRSPRPSVSVRLVIGLTVVAAGTSFPELATSILAGLKGERDIAVGNVVGSNIFNILGVLGLSAIVADGGIPAAQAAVDFDIPIMTGIAIILAPIIFTRREVSRWEGALFIVYYIGYTTYLVLDANDHGGAGAFRAAMLLGVVPLTALAVVGLAAREFVQLKKSGGVRKPASSAP